MEFGFWSVCGYLLASCLIYFGYKILRVVYTLFREYFVLWNVAVGARSDRRRMSTKMRLHVYVCKTAILDEVSINELYTFALGMVESDYSIRDFHQAVLSYKFLIACRERQDGSLRGMMLLGIDHKSSPEDGKSYFLFRLGLALFQNYYRGGPLLYYVIVYHILKHMIFHPRTPVYVAAKAFSYKSYIVGANNFKEFYPRYDAPTPAFEKSIIDEFGRGVVSANELYDSETGVVKRERSVVRNFVAPITEDDLKNPHIRFFVQQNPGWTKGHQLCVLAHITWASVLKVLVKAVMKARHARKEELDGSQKKRQNWGATKYSRQFSFQQEVANKYAVTYFAMDGLHPYEDTACQVSHSVDMYDDVKW